MESVTEMIAELNRHQPGQEVSLTVIRDGSETEVLVTLGEWPEEQEIRINQRSFPREFPNIPRGFRIPRDQFQFEIPGFRFPDLIPEVPHR